MPAWAMRSNPRSSSPSSPSLLPNPFAHRRRVVVAALAVVSLTLASCGSTDTEGGTETVSAETVSTDATGIETSAAAPVETAPVETPAETAAPAETTAPVEPAAPTETVAPSETSAPVGETTPIAAAGDSLDGSWEISTGSEAGYRVPEVLNGQETEGVGRTSAITGSMTIAGTNVTGTEFAFDLTKLKSDSDRRDQQVQTRIMETAKFPTATFLLTDAIDVGKIPADKEEVKVPAKGTLTLHGTTKPIDVELTARRNGANLEVLGSYELKFADFGVPNPSFAPFVEVGETGFIEWLLVFAKK